MTTIILYTGEGVSLSPIYKENRVESNYIRLIADDGKILQKEDITSICIDVLSSDASNWTEIERPPDEPELNNNEALEILLGGITE